MKRYVFFFLAFTALVLSEVMTPQKHSSAQASAVLDLEQIAPRVIGEWEMTDVTPMAAMASTPDDTNGQGERYDRVLMRTYRRASDGATLWLVMAHGEDQRGSFALHLPEMCYRAQGFEVEPKGAVQTEFDGYQGTVKRVLARSPQRLEPISYWVLMNNEIVTQEFGQKLRQLWYGLSGEVSQGMLVRVSMPLRAGSVETAYREQQAFINELLRAWPLAQRDVVWPRPKVLLGDAR